MNEFRLQKKLMGSAFELIIFHEDETKAKQLLENGIAEIQRIEDLLTEFKTSSLTSKINQNAGIHSVPVTKEFYELTRRCIKLSELTQGAFDITIGPLKKLYDFKHQTLQLPVQSVLNEVLAATGFRNIHTGKKNSVYLTRKGAMLSFASIGKGYAADCVKKYWLEMGVKHGVINASGDLSVIGSKPDGSPWRIGIPDPGNKKRMLLYLPVVDGSVATSGDYEQYFIMAGKRYSHTLDPRTGLPLTGVKSVTVTGQSAELCDALATAVSVLGVGVGIHFINQLPGLHCLIIDDRDHLHFSKNITFEKTI